MIAWRFRILAGGALLHIAAGLFAQTIIRDRVVLHPVMPGAKSDPAGSVESEYHPCNPPPSDPGPPPVRRVALYHGDSLSLGATSCPGCPPHHMAGVITAGQDYVRLRLVGTPGEGGEITGTSFRFREAWGYDVMAVFDVAQPADFVVVTFQMTYLDFPPPNQETIEVYLVRPEYSTYAMCDPCWLGHGTSLPIGYGAGHWCAGIYPAPVTYTAEIAAGEDLGLLYDPVSGLRARTLAGLRSGIEEGGVIYFEASGVDPDSSRHARVRITPSAADLQPVEIAVEVRPGPSCPVITLVPERICGGDTAEVVIQRRHSGGTLYSYPPETRFWVSLYAGYEAATLYSPSAPDTGDMLIGVPAEGLRLIVTGEAEEDSISLLLWTMVFATGEGSGPEKSFVSDGQDDREPGADAVDHGKPPSPSPTEGTDECNFGRGVVEPAPQLQLLEPSGQTVLAPMLSLPHMPYLASTARVRYWAGGAVQFTWRCAVTWANFKELPPRQLADTLFGATSATNSSSSTWVLNWGGVLRGGNASISVSVDLDIQDRAEHFPNAFSITGANPTVEQVKDGLTLESQVIIYMESRPKWCQFDADGWPVFGPPHGYGLMQLDNPRATDQEVWSWTANRSSGVALFQQKKQMAAQYPARIRQRARNGELPPAFCNATDFDTEELLLKETFQRYNGGTYWRWVAQNPSDPNSPGRWQPRATSSGYGLRAWGVFESVQQGRPPADWH